MKKVLVYLSLERQCSLFDVIVAYDAGVDVVVPYGGVEPADVEDIVYGCCFTRHPRDLANTGVFVGGRSVEGAEELAAEVFRVLGRLPSDLRVSVAVDPNGAYTTSAACIAKISSSVRVDGAKATVLAGTGPVGLSTARLLAGMGAEVTITSRRLEKARHATKDLRPLIVLPLRADSKATVARAVEKADIVVAAGPPGVTLLTEDALRKAMGIKVLADANAVPPYGIECIKPADDGRLVDGRRCFGALAIGSLKMKLHQNVIGEMFQGKNRVFDLDGIWYLQRNSMLG